MRTTIIEEIEAQRAAAYDPNYHGLVDSRIEVNTAVADAAPGHLILEIIFKVAYAVKENGDDFGSISGRARLVVDMEGIEPQDDGSVDVSDDAQQVIGGAFEDDILLPVSLLARAMKLPNPVRLGPPSARSAEGQAAGAKGSKST